MLSKRAIKKDLRKMVEDVIEECYSIQLYNPKKEAESNKLIDEVVSFYDETVSEIKKGKNKKDAKATFDKIMDKAEDYVQKLNGLQA